MNLNPADILIHIANMLLLFIILRILLYKPIKKFMDAREERFQKQKAEAEDLKKEAEALKLSYDNLMNDAKNESEKTAHEIIIKAEEQAKTLIALTKEQAKGIVQEANDKAKADQKSALENMRGDVTDIALDIAQRVIGKNLNEEDNRAIVDDFFDKLTRA